MYNEHDSLLDEAWLDNMSRISSLLAEYGLF